jgi:hypothetical protein
MQIIFPDGGIQITDISLRPNMTDAHTLQNRRSVNVETNVLRAIEQPPGTIIGWLACHNISQQMLVSNLHDHLFI